MYVVQILVNLVFNTPVVHYLRHYFQDSISFYEAHFFSEKFIYTLSNEYKLHCCITWRKICLQQVRLNYNPPPPLPFLNNKHTMKDLISSISVR